MSDGIQCLACGNYFTAWKCPVCERHRETIAAIKGEEPEQEEFFDLDTLITIAWICFGCSVLLVISEWIFGFKL